MVFIDSFENCVLKCCSLYKNHDDDETAFSLSRASAFTVAIYDNSSSTI